MFETLKKRYEKNFVTKQQLEKYKELGKITQQQYEQIIQNKKL